MSENPEKVIIPDPFAHGYSLRDLYDGIGCEADPERAGKIRQYEREYDEYLEEVMTR